MSEPPAFSRRPAWFAALLSLYFVGALGLAALTIYPSTAVSTDVEPADVALLRGLFALASVLGALILVAALRRWPGVARGATYVHVFIAALALFRLAHGFKDDEPMPAAKLAEMCAKFGVHATLAWIWTRPAVRRAVSRADPLVSTGAKAASPTNAGPQPADPSTR